MGAAGGVLLPGARADAAGEDLAGEGQRHRSRAPARAAHQPDVHREMRTAGGEIARAVQRIDQPVLFRRRRGDTGLHLLLGDDGDVGAASRRPSTISASATWSRRCHWAAVGLAAHREAGGADGHDRLPRLAS